ncbi:MAG: adenylosuccinate lyase [Bacillota bacterium]
MKRDVYNNISPLDHRYSLREKEFNQYKRFFSEKATIKYQARVELALVKALEKRDICNKETVKEVEKAVENLTVEEVYAEEKKTRHNIRALVNCIREKVSEETRPYIHLSATSYDIVDTANSLRYQEATDKLIIPVLKKLLKSWLDIAEQEKATLQIGRTHGQHAEPITFGLTMAYYCSRLHRGIKKLKENVDNLKGKMSGAVGAYNASNIFFEDPDRFEKEVLDKLDLKPGSVSTQIVAPEYMTDFVHSLISIYGILADFSDDMRHLQRSEIREVGEYFEEEQVGSSTMPHKRNPINYENVKSMWKEFMPRMVTCYQDQLSEHQRDLSNSASSRFIPEIAAGLLLSVNRLIRVSEKMHIDKDEMKRNFNLNRDMIMAEPLYIILAARGHPDAHEKVRKLTLKAENEEGSSLKQLVKKDEELKPYLNKLSKRQQDILYNPELYTGIAESKTEEIVEKIRNEQ